MSGFINTSNGLCAHNESIEAGKDGFSHYCCDACGVALEIGEVTVLTEDGLACSCCGYMDNDRFKVDRSTLRIAIAALLSSKVCEDPAVLNAVLLVSDSIK
jgi:hypothetical protein